MKVVSRCKETTQDWVWRQTCAYERACTGHVTVQVILIMLLNDGAGLRFKGVLNPTYSELLVLYCVHIFGQVHK